MVFTTKDTKDTKECLSLVSFVSFVVNAPFRQSVMPYLAGDSAMRATATSFGT